MGHFRPNFVSHMTDNYNSKSVLKIFFNSAYLKRQRNPGHLLMLSANKLLFREICQKRSNSDYVVTFSDIIPLSGK